MRILYSTLHYLLVPFILLRLVWRGFRNRGYWDHLEQRFGVSKEPPPEGTTVWIHAVSVGEVQAALPLVRAVLDRYPQHQVLITTTTPTGRERVLQALKGRVTHRYMPYDLPGAVQRFLIDVRPILAVILETELWPNVLHYCGCFGVPVVLANARLSERSAMGYRRVAGFAAGMLRNASAIAAQTEADARRLVELGADPERLRVTGSVKFDVKLSASLQEEAQALRRLWGVDRSVWIAASTHAGEDEIILDAFKRVLWAIPDCLLVLVPRHPERFARAASLCRKQGYHTLLRSESPLACASADVFVGDSIGELPLFYAASDVAFVGGSLVPVGGHNMLEPAALGLPVIVGPHVFNFAEISRMLHEVGASTRVRDGQQLGDAVINYLQDANYRHSVGQNGRKFVEENRGALDRLMEMVVEQLGQPMARTA